MSETTKRPKKPEHMTSLFGNHLIPKTHHRIAFRGSVDALEAEIIEAQILAVQSDDPDLCEKLGTVLVYLRSIIVAEVRGTPLAPPDLFGMNAEDLHRQSHNAGRDSFVLPSYTLGILPARVNLLRTKVRQTELLGVKAFGPFDEDKSSGVKDPEADVHREDILLALNRLSSALWWLFCDCAKKYSKQDAT